MGDAGQRRVASAGPRYQPLVVVLAAMSAGIFCDRYLSFGAAGCWALAAAFWCAWLAVSMRRRQTIAALLLLVSLGSAAAAWHHDRWRLFARDELGRAATEVARPVCLRAIALRAPQLRPALLADPLRTVPQGDETSLLVRVTQVRHGATWVPVSGRARLNVEGHLLGVHCGDRLLVHAVLYAPRVARNAGEFDFAAFQRARRQLCGLHVSYPDCVSVIGRGRGWRLQTWLDAVRRAGRSLLAKYIHDERAGLAAAVLLGARELVDPELTEDFLTTGTVHLLAISGLHVSILVGGLWWLKRLGLLSRRGALCAAIVFVTAYALVTDARPPVMRAAVLVSVMCCAGLLGRRAFGLNTLALAGILVLLANPTNLFQAGTQLSFLAVGTLSSLARLHEWLGGDQDPLARLIARSRPWPVRAARRVARALAGFWLASAAIWLVSLPLVMYRFHVVTPIAVALNPLVWPPMAAALFSGFGVLIFGWLAPPLAAVCGWCCDASLSVIQWGVAAALCLPGNHRWTPSPPLWWVAVFYAVLVLVCVCPRPRLPWRWIAALACAWFALGLTCSLGPAARWRQRADNELVCTFVAVGHGTSVILELPGGQTLLYDAGQLGSPSSAVRMIASSLWARGISHLDAIVISHADVDHFNAVPGLLERFSVGAVYVSPIMFRDESPATRALREAILARGVPLVELAWGDRLAAGAASIEVLHPPPRGLTGGDNANSIVLRVDYAGSTLLLPGDLEGQGLEDVMAELPLNCDVLMAPHHGSPRSNPVGFAAWSTPEWVIVSGGDRRAPAVEEAYAAAGATVLHTAERGAVQVKIDPQQLCVRTWLPAGTFTVCPAPE